MCTTFAQLVMCLLWMQGLPGSLPWGMFLIFFNDFLAEQKGLSKQVATLVIPYNASMLTYMAFQLLVPVVQ